MPRKNPHRPFIPNPEQMALAPEVSGNAINGLGEDEHRRPSVVYWATNPDDIPHGRMQKWFYTVDPGLPEFGEERAKRMEISQAPLPPVSPAPAQRSPDDWTRLLDQFIAKGLCEKVGVAVMNPDWVYEGGKVSETRVILAGVQHDYNRIATAPEPEAGAEVMLQYTRASLVAKRIAAWLQEEGWAAKPVTGPMATSFTMIPAAIEAGFGELGKHGSIITPELGASFRLAAVLTDAPFAPTPRKEHGIDAFCAACRICEDACPPYAILPEKQTVRGDEKWYVDFDKCLPFFNEHQGCGICIAVCPWSRPGVGLNLAAKLARKASREG